MANTAPVTAGRVVVPRDRLNPRVTHPATADYLTSAGLPRYDAYFWCVDEAAAEGLADLSTTYAHEYGEVPDSYDRWVNLGYLTCMGDDEVFLDGATGVVWVLRDGRGSLEVLNGSVAAFCRIVETFFRGHALIDQGLSYEEQERGAAALLAGARAVDEAAFAVPEAWWPSLVEHIPGWY